MSQRICAALALVALLALGLAPRVAGHSDLVSSDPADGSTISNTPYVLTATFGEEFDPEASTLVVENAAGDEVATGEASPDDPTMMVAQLPRLPDGEYTVRWTTVTPEDNGIERGTFKFTVAQATSTPVVTRTDPPTNPPANPTPGAAGSNDLLIALVLAAVAIGGVVAFVFVRGRRR